MIQVKHTGRLSHNTFRERGSGVIFGILLTLSLVAALGYMTTFNMANTTKKEIRDTLENSLLSAGTLWVKDHGSQAIDQSTVYAYSNSFLQDGLHLDTNNNPLEGSPVTSQVQFLQFVVINNVPAVSPIKGDIVTRPSIEAVVKTTVPSYGNNLASSDQITVQEYARVSTAKR